MKVLVVLVLLISTFSWSQKTFYTKGLEVYDGTLDCNYFNFVKRNDHHNAKISVKFDFSYVEVLDDQASLNYIVTKTEVLDENDYNKGYKLFCRTEKGSKAIISFNLKDRYANLFIPNEKQGVTYYSLGIMTIE